MVATILFVLLLLVATNTCIRNTHNHLLFSIHTLSLRDSNVLSLEIRKHRLKLDAFTNTFIHNDDE